MYNRVGLKYWSYYLYKFLYSNTHISNNGDVAHKWSPAVKGQPIYDEVNQRGKIICSNKQTVDFWVKYIELASTQVGTIKLKAWTSKEYETKNAIYSCLIPKKTCIGIKTVAHR